MRAENGKKPRSRRRAEPRSGRTTIGRRAEPRSGEPRLRNNQLVDALNVLWPLLFAHPAVPTNVARRVAVHRQATDLCLAQGHHHHLRHTLGAMNALAAYQHNLQWVTICRKLTGQDVVRDLLELLDTHLRLKHPVPDHVVPSSVT